MVTGCQTCIAPETGARNGPPFRRKIVSTRTFAVRTFAHASCDHPKYAEFDGRLPPPLVVSSPRTIRCLRTERRLSFRASSHRAWASRNLHLLSGFVPRPSSTPVVGASFHFKSRNAVSASRYRIAVKEFIGRPDPGRRRLLRLTGLPCKKSFLHLLIWLYSQQAIFPRELRFL